MPWLQALVGTQVAPSAHATQAPPAQTMPLPQPLPSLALPACMQTGEPVPQLVCPSLQGWPLNVQALPSAQATQTPAEQTIPVPPSAPPAPPSPPPHDVPFGWFACVS